MLESPASAYRIHAATMTGLLSAGGPGSRRSFSTTLRVPPVPGFWGPGREALITAAAFTVGVFLAVHERPAHPLSANRRVPLPHLQLAGGPGSRRSFSTTLRVPPVPGFWGPGREALITAAAFTVGVFSRCMKGQRIRYQQTGEFHFLTFSWRVAPVPGDRFQPR